MGFWDNILKAVQPVAAMSPRVEYIGGREDLQAYYESGGALSTSSASTAALWRSQPHLRTVVSFLARNIAQLGVHSFERVTETDRARDRTSPVARALAETDGVMTTYELIYALVGDLLLYDRAYWYVGKSSKTRSGTMLRRLPPSWVAIVPDGPFDVAGWRVSMTGRDAVDLPPSSVLAFTGYSPTNPLYGSPTIDSLRAVLQEQVEAASYRQQIWKRGGRVSSVLQRPKDAPNWSPEAREAFREDWYAKYTGRGSKAGGTPILEDGMTLQRIDFNAQEQQFVEAAKLSLVTVASAFHVNPTMIGQNEGANYSNVREFRKMLYGDTLGPLIAQIEARLNTFLVPMLGGDPEKIYVEFNIAEKLQGSFEEQAAAFQTATGVPWQTVNETRARQNLPAVAGGDDLVMPLNVIKGGQASPNDSGSQNRNAGPQPRVKARAGSRYEDKGAQIVASFFARQAAAVKSRLGSKADADWWDAERWDGELATDLYKFALMTSKTVASATLKDIGFSPDEYDVDRTLAWLDEVSKRTAGAINATTYAKIQDAIESDDPDALDNIFTAQESRASQVAMTVVSTISGFATVEAVKQVAGDKATKTWITGPNARPEHAAMDGETVLLSEDFSDGSPWPGGVPGCNCSMTVNT